MTLTIDIGNTNVKSTVFDGTKIINHQIYNELSNDIIKQTISSHNIDNAIISDVRHIEKDSIVDLLKANGIPCYILGYDAHLPFKINYNPKTNLGLDRLSSMAGAYSLFEESGTNFLIIDIGTCTTIDLIVDDVFIGGNISLGLQMRLDAMHHFTSSLPQLTNNIPTEELGTNTGSAIQNGAYFGLIYEINQYIERYSRIYQPLLCILTGGGSKCIDTKDIKCNNLIIEPHLVDKGLNYIMQTQSKNK